MTVSLELPPEDEAMLERMSLEDNVSKAELLRTAITMYLQKCRKLESSGAFGLWRDRNEDSLAYLDRIRDGN